MIKKCNQKGLQNVATFLITQCDKSKLQSTMVFGLQSVTKSIAKSERDQKVRQGV